MQRGADPGAAGPVRRRPAGPLQGHRGRQPVQHPGQPGQPGGEGEHLGPLPAGRAVDQLQQRPRVRRHRAGDVAEHDEPARLGARAGAGQPHRMAAGPPRGAQRRAQVDRGAAPPDGGAAGAARRAGQPEPPHGDGELRELVRGELREVAPAQSFGRRRDHRIRAARPARPKEANPAAGRRSPGWPLPSRPGPRRRPGAGRVARRSGRPGPRPRRRARRTPGRRPGRRRAGRPGRRAA